MSERLGWGRARPSLAAASPDASLPKVLLRAERAARASLRWRVRLDRPAPHKLDIALTAFVLLHLSVISHYFFRERSGDWLRHLLLPLTGLTIIVYVLYEMDRAAKILGLCWIVLGVLYFLALNVWAKKPSPASLG